MEEENNNKVKKEKIKRKRKVSILTVFLWLALIVVMSVITINGIVKNNAVEDINNSDVLKVRINFDGLTDEEKEKKYKEIEVIAGWISYNENYEKKIEEYVKFDFSHIEVNGEYVYVASKEELKNKMSEIRPWDNEYDIYVRNVSVDEKVVSSASNCYLDVTDVEGRGEFYLCSDVDNRLYKNNDLDFSINVKYEKETKIKLVVKFEGIDDDTLEEFYNECYLDAGRNFYYKYGNAIVHANEANVNCSEYIENNKIVVEYKKVLPNQECKLIYVSGELLNIIEDSNAMLKYEINGEEYYISSNYDDVYFNTLNSGEELNINLTIIYTDKNTKATKKAKWVDKEKGIAEIELGYTSTGKTFLRPMNINTSGNIIIYKENLSNEFTLSSEYENNSSWCILENVSEEGVSGIPIDVLHKFYEIEEDRDTDIKYVYVRSTNTVYWLEDDIKIKKGSTNINIVYKDYEKLIEGKEIESSNDSTLVYDRSNKDITYAENYNIASPKLKFSHKKEAVIKVEKNIKGEVGSNTFYVGIFNNKDDKKTDIIYEIKTENGKGSIAIDTEGEKVYVYEVDKSGNKIVDDSIKYSKNEIEFKDYVRDSKITTDKSVISSVMSETIGEFNEESLNDEKWVIEYYNDDGDSDYEFKSVIANTDVNKTVGTGEDDYIDNVLEVVDIYQEEALISSEEIKYKVEYVAEERGTLEGITNEVVKANEYVTNVPKVVPNEGYKFVRFEVEENGERIEVEPSKYVITKDTVFYVVFEKIPEEVMGLPNTSDINVYMYLGIFIIAVIVLIVIIYLILKTNKNKFRK